MTTAEIAADLHAVVAEARQLFARIDERHTTRRSRPDGWCAREVLGHLVDSACNNHRRFVTGTSYATIRFDGYDQDAWVAQQRYDRVAWGDLVTLWNAYNRHLAHVIACTSDDVAARTLLSPEGAPVTLAFVMEDYVSHLRHHLAQIRTLAAA